MSKRKTYFPKADVMMYVCQLNNPATGEQWVDMPAVIKMLDARLGKTILDYALIVHNRDTVTDADIESRDKQRLDYMARMYYQALGSDMSKQDVQNFTVSESLHADALRQAQTAVDAKLPRFEKGAVKPAHLHVVVILNQNRTTDAVAGWFEDCAQPVPELIKVYKDNIKKSGDRKKNALLYLVHKNAPEKAQYRADEVTASFDYCTELNKLLELAALHAQYQVTPDEVNDFINLIAAGKRTARDFIDQYTYAIYVRNQKNIDAAEKERITHHSVVPPFRCVDYFDSTMEERARVGKTTGCYEKARRLAIDKFGAPADVFNHIDAVMQTNPYVFTASVQTLFEGYTGQPIVILDDFRAGDLKSAFKSRAAIKNFLDPFPKPIRFNIKFNTVLPIPQYVLISGIDPFRTFIDDLANTKAAGEQKEKDLASQFYGRFWSRCTFIDATRYIVYKNREYYPAPVTIQQRFYETVPYICSVPAVMRSSLSKEQKAQVLARGFDPLYRETTAYEMSHLVADNLDDFFALYGTPATVKYDGYDIQLTSYDDTRDATYQEIYSELPEGTYVGPNGEGELDDGTMLPFPEED